MLLDSTMKERCRMYRGRGMEIYCRENYMCPSVEEYQEIVKRSKDEVRTINKI